MSLTVTAHPGGRYRAVSLGVRSGHDLAEAGATGTRSEFIRKLTRVDLLVIEDLVMRRLQPTAAEDLLEIFTRPHEAGAILVVPWRTAATCWATPARLAPY